jgi:transposase-like protein
MTTELKTDAYEEVFQNVKKGAEATLKMQQDLLRQWTRLWPGMPTPQAVVTDKLKDFQRQWSNTISDLARRHGDTLNQQYRAALESLEEALRLSESSNPMEFRNRAEQLCRKTLNCMREVSEVQLKEFHDMMNRFGELVSKVGS